MRNKKVWLVLFFAVLVISGLFLVYLGDRSDSPVASLLTSVLVLLITVFFLLGVVFVYKLFYKPRVYGMATLTKRFWAFALDYLFLHILIHVLMVVIVIFMGNFKTTYNVTITTLYGGREEWFITEMGILGVYCIYSTIMDFFGGTLGKKSMDAMVVNISGGKATLLQQVKRNLIKWFMFIPAFFLLFFPFIEIYSFEVYLLRLFILLYIYPKLNPERLFLQDFLAQTKVLDTKYGVPEQIK